MEQSTIGAIIGLLAAIFFILKKITPFYAMLFGAVLGGISGGYSLTETLESVSEGAKTMIAAILRILAAGVLAGVLIQSGAATTIAKTILNHIGIKWALLAIILTSFLITAIGVFIDVAILTIAPIALVTAKELNFSKSGIIVALIGGGKCGNIISPNPNTIAASETFKIELTNLMVAGIIPAVIGLLATYLLSRYLIKRGEKVTTDDLTLLQDNLPSFMKSISGPFLVIVLLSLRPIFEIKIDPILALPLGALVGAILMGKRTQINEFAAYGLSKMMPIAILLLGTGAIAGIITHSTFKDTLISLLNSYQIPAFLLAPFTGIIMSALTASTTSGTVVASSVFGTTLVNLGLSKLSAAVMIHTGATVLDHLPHGSFFHATAASVFMSVKDRLKVIPYETCIGLILTIVATLLFGFIYG
jgi:gluconate:H+ symporter, GntP family